MSFFDKLGLERAPKNDESVNMQSGFKKINGGTQALALIQSAKWNEGSADHNVAPYVQIRFKLQDTSFAGTVADFKAYIQDKDLAKRTRSSDLLSRLYLLAGIAPPDELTDAELARFNNGVLGVEINYWCMEGDDNVWRDGNNVCGLFPTQGFVSLDGLEIPKNLNELNAPKQGGIGGPQQAGGHQLPPAASQAPTGGFGAQTQTAAPQQAAFQAQQATQQQGPALQQTVAPQPTPTQKPATTGGWGNQG